MDHIPTTNLSAAGYSLAPLSQAELRHAINALSPDEQRVLLRKGTEPAFCGGLLDNKLQGFYACKLCNLPLFASRDKFDSGSGWPSFTQPFDPDHLTEIEDHSHGMHRVEITCARCGSHQGHVFPDGPPPTGRRYCLNSISMNFFEEGADLPDGATPARTETAYFAAGCFWGVEDRFQSTPGVIDAASGYQGGHTDNPTYREVCSGETGHAESVRVIFDPSRVSYEQLLKRFFDMHTPTTPNRQGPDVGTQYRSAIFPTSQAQLDAARAYINALNKSGVYDDPIVTELTALPAPTFYEAEEAHQDYNAKHGRSCGFG